ncbi:MULTISPECIES: type 3 dihydrofolate reductase [unclassified Colwellia]|uniref:type 3 dihydrofolate reductase n=1 Tax=unclassified Colwellia TaxID=196834 RepID=UPI0015F3F49C|nr:MULTISPECIES: type 3 dihydrofolate reductase [unclassified Colwellia]MBA6336860.1 type 3 dihydrofolate reductase [Colwellia sp. BRX8-7]MBA6348269.1 type 3 dihydrofolate reductase [Colwellia sp. BRX8-9]MBA6351453.1 type 3 dihydrofolate reductase [Colwellia sp. BRX9-1]MBA6380734.1 type 3 dihydrofolate reductase [Colwellia sp. BRX10-7]MBA6382002.1 type 3 dihydrofolate reductase [Colwellia sp. BRX10-9]
MTLLSMIVAHADNRIIGKDNNMPWHLPADLAYFKKTTLGKPIIMGRKTYESIGRPLPGRQNIVISRDQNYRADGVDSATSVEQALLLAGEVDEVMVIGGGAIYSHCLPLANRLYITHIKADIDGDTQFPEYNTVEDWQLTSSVKLSADDKNSFDVDFCVYQRK